MFAGLTLISYLAVRVILARRYHALDIPNERSSHELPTPRGGGLAISVIVLLTALALSVFGGFNLWSYLVTGALIAFIGWRDDRESLPAQQRFLAQGIATLIILFTIGYWQTIEFSGVGILSLGWLGFLLTLMWIVGLTNAYNFMDGIDGIAGGVACVGGLGWALLSTNETVILMGIAIAAASLGFLAYNWSPARIFMGDVGSTLLGFTFAVFSLLTAAPVIGVLILWPFIFDAVLTFLLRLAHHENVFAAHRSHLYQRLIKLGYSHAQVASLYIALTVIGVGFGWLWLNHKAVLVYILLPLCALGLWAGVTYLEASRQTAQ